MDLGRLETCLHMVQSTSPSYLLMTSLDAARYELALHGEEMLQRGLTLAQMAREAMKRFRELPVWEKHLAEKPSMTWIWCVW